MVPCKDFSTRCQTLQLSALQSVRPYLEMRVSNLFWSLVAICTVIHSCDGLRCYQCQDLPHPRDCVHAASCANDETCYAEEVVTTSGDIVFHTGCMPKLQCTSIGRRDNGHRRAGDITTCIDCCSGEFCNNRGCGTTELPRDQRGPYCFSCDVTWEHQRCNKIITCAKNEICGLHTPRDFFGVPEVVYETSCMSKTQCTSLLNTHSNTKCIPTCCDTDYCNVQCNASSAGLISSTVAPPTTAPPTSTCPPDHMHDHSTGLCIKVFHVSGGQKLSWTAAQSACTAIGDHLVDVDTHQKMNFIQHALAGSNTDFYWIGVRDQYGNDTFYWSNGHKLGYANWGGGNAEFSNQQPDHGTQDCAGIYVKDHFRWHDDPCSMPWDGYICEHSSTVPVIKPYKCDTSGGYKDLGHGLCVHVHREHDLVNWQQARNHCNREHADLVVIDTKAKSVALRQYLDSHDLTRHFWIGGQDMYKNDTFIWLTGQPFTYTDWYTDHIGDHNQPDLITPQGDDEDCVAVYHFRTTQHHWVDDMCSHLHNYVCQRS